MNVFYVNKDPRKAAEALVDQHVNKMVTETAQILSNCYTPERLELAPPTQSGKARKHSYPHHPCCKWARESLINFYWLVYHGYWLEQERLYRGYNPGYSFKFIEWCAWNPPDRMLVQRVTPLTEPPQAFGKDYEHLRDDDPVVGYRLYYNIAKRAQPTLKKVWTRRGPPTWWLSEEALEGAL